MYGKPSSDEQEIARLTAELDEYKEMVEWWNTLVKRASIGTKEIPSLRAYVEKLEAQVDKQRLDILAWAEKCDKERAYSVEVETQLADVRSALNEHMDLHAKVVNENTDLKAELEQAKADKDEMVKRNRVLRDRPDLPAERLNSYNQLVHELEQAKQREGKLREALRDIHIRAQRIRETKAVVGIEALYIARIAQQALTETKETHL